MADLDEKLLEMRREGMSLRQIGGTLGISRMTVARRLKATSHHNEGVTDDVTETVGEEGKCPIQKKHLPSRIFMEFGDSGKQVSHKKTPSPILAPSVNPPEKGSNTLPECRKRAFQGVFLEVGDLFGAIKDFLENKGIEVYQRQSVPECYQVKHNGQIIRLYVERKGVECP